LNEFYQNKYGTGRVVPMNYISIKILCPLRLTMEAILVENWHRNNEHTCTLES